MPPRTSPTVKPQAVSPKAVNVPEVDSTATPHDTAANNGLAAPDNHVYGRQHLNNLLSALFPHRQPLDNGESGGQFGKDS
ncbi:MAG: hypothetical protein ACFB14_20450 [Leptolyngbyaceae cyanobacterium]